MLQTRDSLITISSSDLLNRCKSYELGALIEKLLGKPVEKRLEVDCEAMKLAYANSKSLITAAGLSLQDAADTLQVCS